MSERGEGFRSAEEVCAAAQSEFDNLDLRDRGAVMAKSLELNNAARKGGSDYSKVERLASLLETYDRMTGQDTEERKAA